MAAVIDLHTGSRVAGSRRPGAVPAHRPARPARPALRVVPGGGPRRDRCRPAALPARVYLLRRLVVALVLAALVVLSAPVVGTGLGAVASAVDPVPQDSGRTYTVGAGETLWSIAGRLAPDLDRRVAVDDLIVLNGGPDVRAGQVIRLPATFG